MPKQIEIKTLYGNFDVNVSVPATYEEGDKLVEEVGGVLEGFIADCSARNFLPRLYSHVSKALVEQGHAKKQTGESAPKKDGTKTPVYETPIAHIGRVHDAGDDALKATIGELLQKTASEIPFYDKAERTGGTGKIAQSSMDAANNVFARGETAIDDAVTTIEARVPGYKVARDADGQPTPESLARGMQALIKFVAKAAEKEALGSMGAGA